MLSKKCWIKLEKIYSATKVTHKPGFQMVARIVSNAPFLLRRLGRSYGDILGRSRRSGMIASDHMETILRRSGRLKSISKCCHSRFKMVETTLPTELIWLRFMEARKKYECLCDKFFSSLLRQVCHTQLLEEHLTKNCHVGEVLEQDNDIDQAPLFWNTRQTQNLRFCLFSPFFSDVKHKELASSMTKWCSGPRDNHTGS